MHDWIQAGRRVLTPPGQCRSDFAIVQDLNHRLGSPVEIPSLETCLECSLDLDQEQRKSLQTRGFVQVRPDWVAFSSGTAHADGTFHLLQELHPDPAPNREYPLQLLSLVRRHTVHSQLGESELMEPLRIWVHPEAATTVSLDSGQEVDVVSPLGRIRAELRLDSSLDPGVALCRRGGWLSEQTGINQVIEARTTDLGVGVAYYAQRIRIER